MAEKYLYDHQNGGEILPGELRRGGLCNPIGIDIFETRDKRHGTGVRGSGENSLGNFLPRLFFRKYKSIPYIMGTLSMMPVNKYGLGLQ